jgi:hypothetical protein
MLRSYYFWKWADNNLPGKPPEVWAALLRGELHPALEVFDPRPLLKALGDSASEARVVGEEWAWEVNPPAVPEKARFVFVTCPQINTSGERIKLFIDRYAPLGVSGCDDEGGKLLPGLNPKLNYFVTGQLSDCDIAYDITADELPFLLRRIRPGQRDPWGELWTPVAAVAAIAEGRRFRVEWREFAHRDGHGDFPQWRARDASRLAALNGQDDAKKPPRETDPDFLTRADTLKIFGTLLRGQPRPAQYLWRKLEMAAQMK